MKITMIGTGYVGLVTGTCFASLGNNVICLDIDKNKIDMLNSGKVPIFEPGLKEMIEHSVKEKRINFTTDAKYAVQSSDIIFIAVGTPEGEDGRADLKYVLSAAETIGKYLNGYKVIVDKSTVPVGTADKVKEKIKNSLIDKHDFDVVSNPEFLREGEAIKDFMTPDRVVVGIENDKAKKMMQKLYDGIERTGKPILFTDVKSAEMIKYAANAMLATRISFMNMLAPLCEKVGADIKIVAKGMGLDSRIGPRFLQAGVGYGGSCFPKDVQAIAKTLKDYGCDASILDSVEELNEKQKLSLIPKIKSAIGEVNGKILAVWGLSFKPKTDDMREAPSIVMIKELQKQGAKIKAFDPVAEESAKKIFTNIEYASTPFDAIKGADALIIVTEWDEFRDIDLEEVKKLLTNPIIIDGRNVYDPIEMKELGFQYISVGRKSY